MEGVESNRRCYFLLMFLFLYPEIKITNSNIWKNLLYFHYVTYTSRRLQDDALLQVIHLTWKIQTMLNIKKLSSLYIETYFMKFCLSGANNLEPLKGRHDRQAQLSNTCQMAFPDRNWLAAIFPQKSHPLPHSWSGGGWGGGRQFCSN